MAENIQLTRQASAEIDELTPQKNDFARKLRDLETGVESYSRAEVRRISAQAQEIGMRLFMAQGRLEQLEFKEKLLRRMLGLVEQLAADGARDSVGARHENLDSPAELARLAEARESERRQAARYLHDQIAPLLSRLVLQAQTASALLDADHTRARAELDQLNRGLASGLRETRQLIFELAPPVLDELGLTPTLARYGQLLEERFGRPVGVATTGLERRYPDPIERVLYRAAQEALRQICGRAGASTAGGTIQIKLDDDGERLRLTIQVADAADGTGWIEISEIQRLLGAIRGTLVSEDGDGEPGDLELRFTVPL